MASRGTLKPGALFLHACASPKPEDWSADLAWLGQVDPDTWRKVQRLGELHGVAGWLALCLAAAGPAVESEIVRALKASGDRRLALQLRRRAAAANALTILEQAGLQPILIKGYALAEEVYGSLAARAFGDCDILVRDRDFETARGVLNKHHYRDLRPPVDAQNSREGGHALELIAPTGEMIDLHWRLADSVPTGFEDEIWASAAPPVGRGRLPGLRLAPETMLIQLANHFSHHDFQSVKPLIDFYVSAEKLAPRIAPERLRALADALGQRHILDLTLLICRVHLRPSASIDRLLTAAPAPRAMAFLKRFDPEDFVRPSTPVRRWQASLDRRLAIGGMREALAWLRPYLFPSREFLEERFGKRRRWNHYSRYYGLQVFRLVSRSNRRLREFGDERG